MNLETLLEQSDPSALVALEQKVLRAELRKKLETSQTQFTKYFFRVRGERFLPADHHAKIDEVLDKLERGELYNGKGEKCTILVVTISPRFGKTQYISIDWPARSIARNPRAKFIHLSYSDDLALDNSAKCRETIGSAEYQKLWPVKIKSDADSKKKWYTLQGGGMYATAAGGPVTGFGAGSLADVDVEDEGDEFAEFFAGGDTELDPSLFYGAIIIDDPIKVDDAYNENERNKVNKRLNGTIKNRRNSRNTPIVIVMQRLHEDDMAGFVLANGIEEPVYHLNLPAADLKNKVSMWPAKHTFEELMAMKRADNAMFMAQYMQDPTPEDGTFFLAEYFEGRRFRLGEEPTKLVKYGAGDYAVTEDAGDWTEQAIAGFDLQDNLWFLDWWSDQCTIDKSVDQMIRMYRDHDPMLWMMEKGVIRRAMEPYIAKEQTRNKAHFKVEYLPATASKAVNAKAFQGLCSKRKVYIPYGSWGDDLIAQLLKFTGKDDKVDDKVDVCGLFGRSLDQTFGPAVYHEDMKEKHLNDDYGFDGDDDDGGYGDWRTG